MKKLVSLAPLAFLIGVLPAIAQPAASSAPPKVLQIFREEVKPGKVAAHQKVEAGWPRAFAHANWPVHYMAATSVTGPSEAWFLTGYPSYAAYEDDQHNMEKASALFAETQRLSALDGELLAQGRGMLAAFRDDLSYNTGVNLATMRYFTITITQVRPGHDAEFVEARKIVKAAHEKAGLPDGAAMYQVTAGAPGGTYLTFVARVSLEELDRSESIHGDTYRQALGGEAGQKRLAELGSSAVISSESNHFAFSPAMSYASPQLVAGDPAFWAPQPAPAMKPAPAAKPAPSTSAKAPERH
jgi:hypothetical protein